MPTMTAHRKTLCSAHALRARDLRAMAFFGLSILAATVAASPGNTPGWYDPDGIGVGSEWHYRVPITVPAAAGVASTVTVDVDFDQLLTDLGIDPASVDFDENSPRIVRPNGTLTTTQEFTDERFGNVLDVTGNARGEVRFLLDDAPGAGDHFLYFDVVENGAKAANPQPVINGHFEHSAGTVATGWSTNAINTGGGEHNLVQTTALGATVNVAAGCGTNAANGVDNGPNVVGGSATGSDWYLLGFRNNCEDGGGGVEQVQLTRTFQNPSGAARGTLTFFFQIQSYDGLEASNSNYDYLRVQINGTVLDHTTLGVSNATTPALRIRNVGIGRAGYGNTLLDHGWKQATIDMTQFAPGSTTLTIETRHSDADDNYRMWAKLDDVEWAMQTAVLGAAEECAEPDLSVMKLSRVLSDPFNGTTNAKRIPGALIEYHLTVTNVGGGSVDSGTLALTDPLAAATSLCVSTVCSGGAAPILFSDASSPTPTGLTFAYASDVTFSIDGANFNHVPTPDAGGFDSAITHVRIAPAGAFSGDGALFELRMFAQVN